jgi:hypothetical protein
MILADYQVNGLFPSKVATAGASAVYFPRTFGSQFNVAPSTPTTTNATGQLNLPGSQYGPEVNGMRLRAVASGSLYSGASQTVTVTMQINTGTLTSVAYTTMATASQATFTGRASWLLEAHFVIGSLSTTGFTSDNATSGFQANFGSPANVVQGQLSGLYTAAMNGAGLAAAWTVIPATTNPVQWIGPTPAGLLVNVQFVTGSANDAATLNEFAILGD